MNILVTGAKGFLGKNLVESLKTILDGKNPTRPNLRIHEIYEYDQENTLEDLDKFCSDCDFIVHTAGVNRPKEPVEFMEGNFGFTSVLLDKLKAKGNKVPILITSSIQAALCGRFENSQYGRSKLAGEELMFSYSEETGAPVYVYRLPNLVGKWGRDSYNSACITFCHHIARDMPVTVHDPLVELELLFADDLCEEIYDCMEGHPHYADFPGAGEVVNGIEYDGVTPRFMEDGRYCAAPVTYKATVGEIVGLLYKFHDQRQNIMMPDLTPGSFEKKLYAMYLSYLPKEKAIFDLHMNRDHRGSFTELMRTANAGQVSVNISKPGITKGEHWHLSKHEQFIVVKGHGLIQMRRIGTDEVWDFEVNGDRLQSVFCIPGYAHNIINLSDTEDLVTVMIASEIFDPAHPDTYGEKVVQ